MKQLDIGAIYSEAMDIYTKHWKLLLTLGAAIYLVTAVIGAVVAGVFLTSSSMVLTAIGGLIGVILLILASILLQGMFVLAAADLRDGHQDLSVGDLFTAAKPLIGPLFITGLLAALGIVFGFILLIVPGLVLLTWWAFASAVVMLEGTSGTDALNRSREIVAGNGWRVFGLILLTAIIVGIVNQILGSILGGLAGDSTAVVSFVGVLPNIVTGPFQAIVPVLAYFALVGDGTQGAATPGVVTPPAATSTFSSPPAPAAPEPAAPAAPSAPESAAPEPTYASDAVDATDADTELPPAADDATDDLPRPPV